VLNGVEQAASDAEIIKTLEGGATALEKLNKDIGGIEKVERIMERVREGIEESEDVGRVIVEMGVGSVGKVDESEVQEEFDAMLKAEEDKQREIRDLEEKIRKRELEEKVKKQQEKENVKETEKNHDGLVEELKSVSLEEDKVPRVLEEPIPG
jgi:charged multivesicular body protein 7